LIIIGSYAPESLMIKLVSNWSPVFPVPCTGAVEVAIGFGNQIWLVIQDAPAKSKNPLVW
jgi:hypothetical protein